MYIEIKDINIAEKTKDILKQSMISIEDEKLPLTVDIITKIHENNITLSEAQLLLDKISKIIYRMAII